MSTEIYYFSGTGNSLHVARELQKRVPEANLIPVVHLLHDETIKTSADTIGFVFPNFCLTIPIPMHDFLERADLASAQYIFAVCTRGGSQSEAFRYIDEILKKQDKRLHAQLDVDMPWNHCIGKENLPGTNSLERIRHLESVMQSKLEVLSKSIVAKDTFHPADDGPDYRLSSGINLFDLLIPRSLNYKSHEYMYQNLVRFYADPKCNGCGICAEVCLSGRIELIDDKPKWKKGVRCYACFACINFCPRQAIQVESRFPIRSYSEMNDRYHHKSVTYRDIAEQR